MAKVKNILAAGGFVAGLVIGSGSVATMTSLEGAKYLSTATVDSTKETTARILLETDFGKRDVFSVNMYRNDSLVRREVFTAPVKGSGVVRPLVKIVLIPTAGKR